MVIQSKESNSAYFTVDFECFTHDLCRSLGADRRPKLRTSQLIKSINNLENIISSTAHDSTNLTFFCTAISADLYPDVLKEIAARGHEIACHGNFHDDIDKMGADELYHSLKLAKDKISQTVNQDVIGFRAPRFSINKNDFERLDVISQLFKYDSSLHFENQLEFDNWKQKCNLDIIEFPVPQQRMISSKFKVKLGGSYLKLFPSSFVKKAASISIENGLTPIFYFHPYDLYFGYGLLASWKELQGANFRTFWYLRQIQWAGILNWSQQRKLQDIFLSFNNIGPLGERIQDMYFKE